MGSVLGGVEWGKEARVSIWHLYLFLKKNIFYCFAENWSAYIFQSLLVLVTCLENFWFRLSCQAHLDEIEQSRPL